MPHRVAQTHRDEERLPRGEGRIGGAAKRDVDPGLHRAVAVGEPYALATIAQRRADRIGRGAYRASQHAIERVPQPRRAVIEVVVVSVVLVLLERVPAEEIAQ